MVAGVLRYKSETCPHCLVSLIAEEIPAQYRHYYIGFKKDPETGKYVPKQDDGRPMHYYKTIGMSSLLFDRILAYRCPHCNVIDVIPGLEKEWEQEQAYWSERK